MELEYSLLWWYDASTGSYPELNNDNISNNKFNYTEQSTTWEYTTDIYLANQESADPSGRAV